MSKPTLSKKHEFKLPSGVLGASLSPDGASLVAACMDGVYRLNFDPHEHQKLYSHGSYVSSTEWLANDKILSAGYDGTITWFDQSSNECTQKKRLHDFWSWDMAVSPDEKLLASVTGQYLAGGYKYEPQHEREPSLKIVSIESGETLHSLPHVPSVQAVAFSPDSHHVAAGNLMGEVRVFNVETGELVASWTTPDFTSWGIIKSHCYLGGIFGIKFTPDGKQLLLCGMGPMRDPMAGNGRQLWQKWSWQDSEPNKVDETHKGESGEGLMETLAVHPAGQHFVMGGRLRGGDWNVALFDLESGDRIAELKTGYRVTEARYNAEGDRLVLVGAQGQPSKKKEGRFPNFGRVDVYEVQLES
jgi:WD40 repeat protein